MFASNGQMTRNFYGMNKCVISASLHAINFEIVIKLHHVSAY